MTLKDRVEVATKVLLTIVTFFGVWQYFADRADATRREARERTLSTIALSTGPVMLAARHQLYAYWASEPELIEFLRKAEAIGPNDYENFVRVTLPRSIHRDDLFNALNLISEVYTAAFFCRNSGVCDADLLDAYYCKRSHRYAVVYGPYFRAFNREVAGSDLGAALHDYVDACRIE